MPGDGQHRKYLVLFLFVSNFEYVSFIVPFFTKYSHVKNQYAVKNCSLIFMWNPYKLYYASFHSDILEVDSERKLWKDTDLA
jgi:hypothetical protein